MKHVFYLSAMTLLMTGILSCSDKASNSLGPSSDLVSKDASKGIAIYIADPGKNIASEISCQVNLSKVRLVGKPLTEAEIEHFDQGQATFKLKVSQYDWLGENKAVIQEARNQGYYAMVLTLDGVPIFGGYVLSGVSSYACTSGEPYFWEDNTYSAPNPGPNPRSDYSYHLPLKRNLKTNTPANQAGDMVLKTRTRNLLNFVYHESIPTSQEKVYRRI